MLMQKRNRQAGSRGAGGAADGGRGNENLRRRNAQARTVKREELKNCLDDALEGDTLRKRVPVGVSPSRALRSESLVREVTGRAKRRQQVTRVCIGQRDGCIAVAETA
jgi:hypothetical protein